MSTEIEKIKQLQEQASELYLNGDYGGAIRAWRGVLELDASDEQALAGVHMAEQFIPPAPVAASEPAGVEDELDQGLKILDGVNGPSLLPPAVTDGAIDSRPVSEHVPELEPDETPEGWEVSPAQPVETESYGLEALSRSAPSPAAPASAAAAELKRRVDDLLTEAKSKAEAGERDEALSILARLGILDEDNAEAEALRLQIEAAGASDLDKVEQAIIEGVAALEANRLDDAEAFFRQALALAPEHREAKHYLEKVEQRRTGGSEDLLGGLDVDGEAAPADDAVHRATAAEATPVPVAVAPKPPRPAPAPAADLDEAPLAASGPRVSLPSMKLLLGGGLAALALLAAATTLPKLFGHSKPKFESVKAPVVVPHAPRTAKSGAGSAVAAPAVPASPEERARVVKTRLAAGQSSLESGDAAAAILAFNDVLAVDPANAVAKAGIADAGDRYKAKKAERDALNGIELAFRDGEFTSGLRAAYRLPPTVSKTYVDGVKVAGWYNLAIVALRAGDCREAQSHLDEALTVSPADQDSLKLRAFASQYADAVKDRAFLDRVEALSFRPLPRS